jgi:hypothetical protein
MDKFSEIADHSNDITLTLPAGAGSTTFCQMWPGAKQALETLQKMIRNPLAKGAIQIVIEAGDGVYRLKC